MKYSPLFNNVLVKPLKKEEGTIITEPDPTEPIGGSVVMVGTPPYHAEKMPPYYSLLNTNILFFPQDAKKLKLDGEDYYLLNQEDILLKIT